jgi:predicted peptidase
MMPLLRLGALLTWSLLFVLPTDAGEKTGIQVEKQLTNDKIKVNYLLFLPEDYGKADKQWPAIVFLHGGGECGMDLSLVKKHGPPKIVEAKKDFPFIVVSPQAPNFKTAWNVDTLNALLDEVLAKYKVDANRVYLTGLSMGGGGT